MSDPLPLPPSTATWDQAAGAIIFAAAPGLRFRPEVAVDGRVVAPRSWQALPDGGAQAEQDGVVLRIACRDGAARATVGNRGGAPLRLDAFRFRGDGGLLARPGRELRLYTEGWTMTTPAMSVRWGEREPLLNPDYRAFAAPDPAEQGSRPANRFHADFVAVLDHAASGTSLLVGFITSADQVARIAVELAGSGPTELTATSLGDGIAIPPGGEVASEELVALAGAGAEALLTAFAARWGARMQARAGGPLPTGWCSWYYYFEKVTERDVLENADWLAANRGQFPLDYVQVDDGWQAALGDWTVTDPARFPHGPEWLVQEIRRRGFRPGLWLAPFLVEERSRLAAEHPAWLVQDRAGATVWAMDWRGCRTAILDCTRPEACAWLEGVFATLAGWGVDYAKLDFLVHESAVTAKGGVYADPGATRVQALRRGLAAIRRGFGEGRVLLACTNVLGAGVGLVDACRIGTDFLPDWNRGNEPFREAPTVPNVCRNIINRTYLDRRLWINDPDTVIVRSDDNRLNAAEVRMWVSALWFAGGMTFAGDRLSTLTPERIALLKLLLDQPDAVLDPRPLDRFAEEYPALWCGRLRRDPTTTVVGAFNFGEQPRTLRIDCAAAGLPAGRPLAVRDFWEGGTACQARDGIDLDLAPHTCRVLLIAPI